MRPGPPVIVRTPRSGTLVQLPTWSPSPGLAKFLSGRPWMSLGAPFTTGWTDGKLIQLFAPPLRRRLLRVPGTDELFWSDTSEPVGRAFDVTFVDTVDQIPVAKEASFDDCLRALTHGVVSDAFDELDLRMYLWWDSNDPVRSASRGSGFVSNPPVRGDTASVPLWSGHGDNLRAIVPLLSDDEAPQVRVLTAEAWRELGAFSDAERVLDEPFPDSIRPAVAFLRQLCAERDTAVREYPFV